MYTPPPSYSLAVLSDRVLLVRVRVAAAPELVTPPPLSSAKLPEMVLRLMAIVPRLSTPPPERPVDPPVMVRRVSVRLPVFSTARRRKSGALAGRLIVLLFPTMVMVLRIVGSPVGP